MILIGAGANLSTPYSTPQETVRSLPRYLQAEGIWLICASSLYRTAPVGMPRGTPDFVNAVLLVQTRLSALDLLDKLKQIERIFGRQPEQSNRLGFASRCLDLDLLDYRGQIYKDSNLCLPHQRMHERLFVLRPLAEIAPAWYHPLFDRTADELAKDCDGQRVTRLEG